ncbi:uncharacterized protein PpBr36_06380 [Pyricularia pennisetigena]|uniref:uncharacterized protein n=1 Tax=Pyricularia pennisetigena TaxID=1578925 RepID=UPI001154BD93|nr:uncharacterized protein PpBr36_06380 [Pyricularia pennisetigena]TLS23302.1 hypothetical protein PpBr36_06380 [Pyricularia pennisetigena]
MFTPVLHLHLVVLHITRPPPPNDGDGSRKLLDLAGPAVFRFAGHVFGKVKPADLGGGPSSELTRRSLACID